MPRQARLVIPGLPHHVTQRGNNRQHVFFVDSDRIFYLEMLHKQREKYGVQVLGYCLMTNHVHLVATPSREDFLTLAIGRTHLVYTQYTNRLHRRSGHLWQDRFYSCPMDDGTPCASTPAPAAPSPKIPSSASSNTSWDAVYVPVGRPKKAETYA